MLTATPARPHTTHEDHDPRDADHRTLGRVAADRARALRHHAATIRAEYLEPLRAALHVRAAELELAAAALGEDPAVPTRRTA